MSIYRGVGVNIVSLISRNGRPHPNPPRPNSNDNKINNPLPSTTPTHPPQPPPQIPSPRTARKANPPARPPHPSILSYPPHPITLRFEGPQLESPPSLQIPGHQRRVCIMESQ